MYAVLSVPQFSLQSALRHEVEQWSRPVALVDSKGSSTPRVVEATRAARECGVVDGATAPQALARCANLLIRHRSPALEALSTAALLQGAYGFSPHLESTAPGVVTLDLRGLIELRGDTGTGGSGQARLAWGERLSRAMGAWPFQVRVGIGPTPSVARYAAQWGKAESPGVMTGGNGQGDCGQGPRRFCGGTTHRGLGPLE